MENSFFRTWNPISPLGPKFPLRPGRPGGPTGPGMPLSPCRNKQKSKLFSRPNCPTPHLVPLLARQPPLPLLPRESSLGLVALEALLTAVALHPFAPLYLKTEKNNYVFEIFYQASLPHLDQGGHVRAVPGVSFRALKLRRNSLMYGFT